MKVLVKLCSRRNPVDLRLGDKEKALAVLEEALANGYRDFAAIGDNPHLASLRTEPRFQELLDKYG